MRGLKGALVPILAAATVGLAGCGLWGGGGGPDGPAVTVEVHNNFAGAATQRISIVGEGAAPVALGTVEAGATERFTARDLDLADVHRLIADSPTGGLIRSAPVTLEAGSAVVWDLSTNRVHLQD